MSAPSIVPLEKNLFLLCDCPSFFKRLYTSVQCSLSIQRFFVSSLMHVSSCSVCSVIWVNAPPLRLPHQREAMFTCGNIHGWRDSWRHSNAFFSLYFLIVVSYPYPLFFWQWFEHRFTSGNGHSVILAMLSIWIPGTKVNVPPPTRLSLTPPPRTPRVGLPFPLSPP